MDPYNDIINVIKKHMEENIEDLEANEINPWKTMKAHGADYSEIKKVVSDSMRSLGIKAVPIFKPGDMTIRALAQELHLYCR